VNHVNKVNSGIMVLVPLLVQKECSSIKTWVHVLLVKTTVPDVIISMNVCNVTQDSTLTTPSVVSQHVVETNTV